MVDQGDVHQGQRLFQVAGEGLVGRAWLGQAGGVIVGYDQRGGMVPQGLAYDFARITEACDSVPRASSPLAIRRSRLSR